MAGTSEGSRKTAAKLKAQDPDHFKKMGIKGGGQTGRKGFAVMAEEDPELHRSISARAGRAPRRKRT